MKKVAVENDISASAGSGLVIPAVSGSWTPGSISKQTHAKLTVGGAATVWQASCSFSFLGSDSNGVSVTGSNTVTLTAKATKLQGGGDNVLLHGDQASDSYGNKLSVSASGKLRSA